MSPTRAVDDPRYMLLVGHLAEWLQVDDGVVITAFPWTEHGLIVDLNRAWLDLLPSEIRRIQVACLLTMCARKPPTRGAVEVPRRVLDEVCARIGVREAKRVRTALLQLPGAVEIPLAATGHPVRLLQTGHAECRAAVLEACALIRAMRPVHVEPVG